MTRIVRSLALALGVPMAVGAIAGPGISASLGGQVLKGAAVGFAVTKTAKPLNKFINTITLRNHMQTRLATKVVPILSVGEKGYIGGAQVCGPAGAVEQVEAVFEYEKNFSNNNYRAKVLLPSASLNPLKLKRVAKVGVTAVIEYSLDGKLRHWTVGTGIQAGDVIRGGAVLVAVKNFGPSINKALNTITFNSGMATRVVPMASVGEKMYLGAAQVSGSRVGTANALWQYEDVFAGQFRVKVLVPTTSSNPLKMKRVDGAGVTAIVDMALSEQKDVNQQRPRNRYTDILGGIRNPKAGYDDKRSVEPVRDYRKDNGKHKGWYIGKHKGWDRKDKGRK